MRHFQNWAFVQKFMKAFCPKRKFICQPPICRGKLVSRRFVLRCIEDNTGSWPQHVAAAGGFARFLGVLVTWLPAFLGGEFLRSDPWDSKDYSFDCWSCKDHYATKHFQVANPLDSYFYSLGLPGWFVTLYNLFSGLWPNNPASTTWRQEIADRFVPLWIHFWDGAIFKKYMSNMVKTFLVPIQCWECSYQGSWGFLYAFPFNQGIT